MAESVTCDGCGQTAPTAGLFGWWEVGGLGMDVRPWGEAGGPWHFCDLACLQGWTLRGGGS